MRSSLTVVACCCLVAACAGYRGGWQSLPYVGADPPRFPETTSPSQAQQQAELALPGLNLGVNLNNQLRTYDTQVYLFAVPLGFDPRNVYQQEAKPGITRLTLKVAPILPGFVFRHRFARLTVGTTTVSATAAYEFGMWDSAGQAVSAGGKWGHRPLPHEFSVSNMVRPQILSLEFPIERPPPESSDVSLDLSEALASVVS